MWQTGMVRPRCADSYLRTSICRASEELGATREGDGAVRERDGSAPTRPHPRTRHALHVNNGGDEVVKGGASATAAVAEAAAPDARRASPQESS